MNDAMGERRGRVPGVIWLGLVVGTAGTVLTVVGVTGGGLSFPALFIALSAVMLMLGLAAFWQSLRALFGGGPELYEGSGSGSIERTSLLEEKQTLLRAIKDITFEREIGKLSEDDFQRLDRAYRRRAKEVLRRLDQDLEPFLRRAEQLVAVELGEEEAGARAAKAKRKKKRKKGEGKLPPAVQRCGACDTANDLDAEHCKECGARLTAQQCPSCGTRNDPDAKFCKRCATVLRADEARAGASAGGESDSGGSDSGGSDSGERARERAEVEASGEADGSHESSAADSDSASEREAGQESEDGSGTSGAEAGGTDPGGPASAQGDPAGATSKGELQ